MCHYKTLHRSRYGYAVMCQGCKKVHVGLKHIVLNYSYEQFIGFCKRVNKLFQMNQFTEDQSSRTISIATDTASINLLFNLKELANLNELLSNAQDKLMLEKLFEFNEN